MSASVLAPVLVVTYSRLEHLKKTITSLRNNILAEYTDLYIASDFQRSEIDAEKVAAIRKYIYGIDGFKSLKIFEREKNLGAAENTFSALKFILNKHDRFILMEDDVVTARGFLSFINDTLEKLGKNTKVFSVAGYCPPISIPSSYRYDAFFLGRMSAWGCAMMKDRYESVRRKIPQQEYGELLANKKLARAFTEGGGADLLKLFKLITEGSLDAWDVRCMYTQFMKNQYTVYPTQSLVQNIGFDGSGINCGQTERFDVVLSGKTTFRLPDEVVVNQKIVKANFKFREGFLPRPSYAKRILWKARGVVRRIQKIC